MLNMPLMEKAWENSKKNIFRLEEIPEYNVPEDLVNFNKWKHGKFVIDKDSKNWLANLKSTKNKRINIQRVRIVSFPFSNYLKYEIDFWQHSTKAGEKILFLDKAIYQKIKFTLDFSPEDFWLFDDKTLIIFHYNPKGDFVREEPILDPQTINKYVILKKELLRYAISMSKFLTHPKNH